MYVEGSYFGDTDTLLSGLRVFERDSTAVAATECQFFVLSRVMLHSLRLSFGREIQQMQDLALRRKQRHKKLIKLLEKKVKII